MKNDFATKFFWKCEDVCELLGNGLVKEFLYDVNALQDLINIE